MADKLENPAVFRTAAPPPGAIVSGYQNKPYGYSCFRPSGTKDWLIMFTLSGVGCVRYETHVQRCGAGDLIILPPGTPHDYFTPEGCSWEMMWAHYIPRQTWAGWFKLPRLEWAKDIRFAHLSERKTLQRIRASFERLIADNRAGANQYREELSLNALEEILLMAVASSSKESEGTLDPRVHEVLSLLNDNIMETYSLKELAKRVCLSPSRLAHLFKEQTGDSIIETQIKIRLRQAARLLELTTRQIAEIADDVGFHSPDYFSRKFTQFYGMNPRMYRKTRS